MIDQDIRNVLERFYSEMDGSEEVMRYSRRHGIDSLAVLTMYDDERASLVARHLADRVRGKVVVEIGGAFGLLALHLSDFAKRIFVIEANPVWTSVYVAFLHRHKPKNVTFIFGSADEVKDHIRGDIGIFCTHSDARGMMRMAQLFAPEVVDVYGDLLDGMNGDELPFMKSMRQESASA